MMKKETKKELQKKKKCKKTYLPPILEVTFVEMESGIAAGSATVVPNNVDKEVLYEWEEDPNKDGNIIL